MGFKTSAIQTNTWGEIKMRNHFSEHWDQYGLVAELAVRLQDVSPQFGKTVLQKMIYILQEIYETPCNYEYTLYNYGPYSEDLAADLKSFASMEGVTVQWSDKLGYKIMPAAKTEHFRQRAGDFLEKYDANIQEAVNLFGEMTARDLELRSTIIYVSKQSAMDKNSMIDCIKEIKPHFSVDEIATAIEQLVTMDILHLKMT